MLKKMSENKNTKKPTLKTKEFELKKSVSIDGKEHKKGSKVPLTEKARRVFKRKNRI